MSRRFSTAEKGKRIQQASPPRKGRVQVPDFDNSDLLRRHELTLIGRITNARYQRMWSLIPFLAEHWKCSTKPEGADLGQGRFQFLFSSHEDMQKVLDNRPYHFAHWMVIIEKWEPTISPSFPSQIPFWIQLQNVPVHLWNEAILRVIGEDMGRFDSWEITATKARFRVHINALLPLLKQYTLDFANGDEIEATLLYEKLEKHCSLCHRLDHEKDDCPQNPAPPRLPPVPNHSTRNPHSSFRQRDVRREPTASNLSQRAEPFTSRREDTHSRDLRRTLDTHTRDLRRTLSRSNPSLYHDRRSHSHSSSHHSPRPRTPVPQWVDSGRRLPPPPPGPPKSPMRTLSPSEGENAAEEAQAPPLQHSYTAEDLLKAQEDLRDFMNQYSNCVDPTERAARKERFRLAEELGEFEQTAINMAITSSANRGEIIPALRSSTLDRLEEQPHLELSAPTSSETRPSALNRLGPQMDVPTGNPSAVPVKKRLGRPPGKKTQPTPNLGVVSAIKKPRRTVQAKGSPKRRTPTAKGPKLKNGTVSTSTRATPNPSTTIIPPVARRSVDFRLPQNPPP